MIAKLTSIVRDIYERTVLASRITDLTGGESAVEAVIVTAVGTGYTSAPTVGFTGGGGSGAAGTAVLESGVVVRVDMTNPGTGYTSAPTVGFTGGGGSGAAATAVMSAETLDAVPTEDVDAGTLHLMILVDGVANLYRLTAGTDTENAPWVVRPDDYAGTTNEKVWKLTNVLPGGGKRAYEQIDAVSGAGTNTVTIDAEIYHFHADSGTTDADFATSYDITGVPDEMGRHVIIHLTAEKGITASARSHSVNAKINGANAGQGISTPSQTGAATVHRSLLLSYHPGPALWTWIDLDHSGI